MKLFDLTCVTWSENLLGDLNSMRMSSQLCDVKIVLEHGELLLAHSSVLAASSPFFKSVLDGVEDPEIDLGDFPGELIKQVINFIYTGRSLVNNSELDLFSSVADTLHISVLSDLVKQILSETVGLDGLETDCQENDSELCGSLSESHVEDCNDVQEITHSQDPNYVLNGLTRLEPAEINPEELLTDYHANSDLGSSIQDNLKTLFKVEDNEASNAESLGEKSHARQTLPNVLVFGSSLERDPGEDEGVFTSAVIYVPKHVLFGPYEGIVTEQPCEQNRYCWKISKNDGDCYWIDGTDESKANWMRFVNHTHDTNLQNLEAFQHQGQLYFRTVKDLPPNTELLVRHTDQYKAFDPEISIEVDETLANESAPDIPYTCKECNVAYSSDILYHKHMRSKHGHAMPLDIYLKIQKERGMDLEPFSTQTEDEVNCLENKHSERVKDADCDGRKISNSGMTVSHSKHKNPQMEEIPDGKGDKHRTNKKAHQRVDGKGELKIYTCSVCDRHFKKIAYLKQHEDVHVNEKPYKCPKCGKRFVREVAYNNHLKRHDAKRKHVCSVCGRGFFQARPLEIHLRRHTGERPFKCPMCGRGFTDVGNLDRHKRLHTGEKPYQCSTCGKSFTQSGHLREHIRHHTGDKPFICSVCGQAFTNNSNLQAHTRIHTGERPFVCTVCGKCYRDAAYLKSHGRIHTGEKPYICLDCGMAFADNSKMRFHRRQKHHAGLTRPPRKSKTEIPHLLIDD